MTKKLADGERKDKLKYVAIDEIIFENRAREDYGDLDELKHSILEKGVIQPITLDADLNLIAGGRRYSACLALGFTSIPAIIRPVSDEVDTREIELMENVFRKDFTWQERAKLTAQIDELYKAKNPNWSQNKTAELLDIGKGAASRQIQLAAAMKFIPEVAQCKTADDALKMVKKLEEQTIVQELRRRQDEQTAKPTQASGVEKGVADALKLANQNYNIGDVFAGMSSLRTNGSIDIIECDPPYGIDLNENKAGRDSVTSTVTGYKEVAGSEYEGFLDRLTSELYRVAGKDCWLIFWYGPSWHQAVLDALRKAGWAVDEIPAIWAKPNGQTLQPELYFARCYEPFFLCRKGKPVMAERGRSNVFNHSGAKDKYHPTQRPTELIEDIFTTLSTGMEKVFIPFLGSGATLRACYNKGLSGFGFDLDGKYKDQFMLAVEEDTRKLFRS